MQFSCHRELSGTPRASSLKSVPLRVQVEVAVRLFAVGAGRLLERFSKATLQVWSRFKPSLFLKIYYK